MAEGDIQKSAIASLHASTAKKPSETEKDANTNNKISRKSDRNYSFSKLLTNINRKSKNDVRDSTNYIKNSSTNNFGKTLYEDRELIANEAKSLNDDQNDVIDYKYRSYYDNVDEEIKKNVWSDVDDDIYIAKLVELRTSKGYDDVREKRDTSVYLRDKGSDKVVNSVKDIEMWEIEPTELSECDCLGPPPEFLLPPPPRPPFLHVEYNCGDNSPIPDLETCDTEPKIDAYNHGGPSLQTSAVIALCSVVLVLGIFIGAVLVWKHKRKVTNLLPSKSSAPAVSGGAQRRVPPAPLYEDLQDLPRRPPLPHRPDVEPQLEMVETKRVGCPGRVFVCGAGNWRDGNPCSDACGAPLYEELPHRSDDSLHSDDHFAEDELSLVGEAAPCRTCSRPPPHQSLPHRSRPPRLDRRPRSLERRRAHHAHRFPRQIQPPDPSEFHEGVLLDALLRLYPQVGTVGARPQGSMAGQAGGAWPGGDLPSIGCWRGPRASPKPPSGDSSFGSDSGYSNNTCGTCGTRGSSRHRLSAEIPMS